MKIVLGTMTFIIEYHIQSSMGNRISHLYNYIVEYYLPLRTYNTTINNPTLTKIAVATPSRHLSILATKTWPVDATLYGGIEALVELGGPVGIG